MLQVTVIGGITVDIEGVPTNPLINKDSNPGTVNLSYGGVGKNIAENLIQLGVSTHLISAIGSDILGKSAFKHLKEIGLDTTHISVKDDSSTATYVSILNDRRDMELALNDMAIFDDWQCDLKAVEPVMASSDVIVIDTNISISMINNILDMYPHKKILVDPVSVTKGIKVRERIGAFEMVTPNILEAQILTGITIDNQEKLESAGDILLRQGVKKVFITMGEEGVYYKDSKEHGIVRTPPCTVISASGAGDAFTAGVVYGLSHSLSIKEQAYYGCTAAYFALQSEKTVNNQLSSERIIKSVKGIF